jgi:hypothetical protein
MRCMSRGSCQRLFPSVLTYAPSSMVYQAWCVTQWLLSCAQLGFSLLFSGSPSSSMRSKDVNLIIAIPKISPFISVQTMTTSQLEPPSTPLNPSLQLPHRCSLNATCRRSGANAIAEYPPNNYHIVKLSCIDVPHRGNDINKPIVSLSFPPLSDLGVRCIGMQDPETNFRCKNRSVGMIGLSWPESF